MSSHVVRHSFIHRMVVMLAVLTGCGSAPAAPQAGAPGTSLAATRATPSTLTATTSTMPLTAEQTASTLAPSSPAKPASSPSSAATAQLRGSLTIGTSPKYRLQMHCLGTGSPTVVLDAGHNGGSSSWRQVQPELAHLTRVCVYNRTGASRKPHTSQQMLEDLRALLDATGVPPPYVLVGMSFAGLHTRLFTHQFPDEVAGIILVDASHEDENRRWLALLPPQAASESQPLKALRKELLDETYGDDIDWKTSEAQLRASGKSLDDIPLVVLTAGKIIENSFPDLPADLQRQMREVWIDMHRELAALSSNSKHIMVEDSGHCIQCEQPQAVIDAVRSVVDAVRSGQRLDTQ